MRIDCPSCAAEYEVPASRLKPDRLVRCARCGGEWIPSQPEDDIPPATEAAADAATNTRPITRPSASAMDRLAARPASRPAPGLLVGAWVLTAVVLVGGVAAVVTWRAAVMRAWPPSTVILAPFGQPAPAAARSAGKQPG